MKAKKAAGKILAAALAVSMTAVPCQGLLAATTSNEVTDREKENAAIARSAAAQSMVLLENKNQALPLKGKTIALFGGGAARTVRGGNGSGDPFNGGLSGGGDINVNQSERYNINICNSLLKAGYQITTKDLLDRYTEGYDKAYQASGGNVMSAFAYPELEFTDEELQAATEGTDTAVYVISRNAGEGADRSMTKTVTVDGVEYELGDYALSQVEIDNLRRVSQAFENTIVVLNVGGVVDTAFFDEVEGLDALLLMGQCGQEGGNALMDVLNGTVTPSGKLTSTWAKQYGDYPAAGTFADQDGNHDKEVYEEGIYVGYRYFDTFGIDPAYAFGYGQSYTDFDMEVKDVSADEEKVTVEVEVTNTGDTYSGKEVVQVYYSAPDTSTEKEYQELAAFGKTDELAPQESQTLKISYDVNDMAFYDEARAAYVLDSGTYYVRVGNSSRNTHVAAALEVNEPKITEQLSNQMEVPADEDLQEWSKEGKTPYTYEGEAKEMSEAPVFELDSSKIQTVDNASEYDDEIVPTYTTDPGYVAQMPYEDVQLVEDKSGATLKDVADGKVAMEEFIAQMSLEEMAKLNCGSGWGVADEYAPVVGSNSSTIPGAAGETIAFEQYGIPSIVLADGPGGIRVKQEYEATNTETGEKDTYYQYCTAWPVGYVLAQSWDVDLIREVGRAFGVEMEELGITLLLGPALNIHRDPLCGRNFEYFSEDPLVSGIMASEITKGVQSIPGVGACLKHYAANNQETNRNAVDTIVSERTLREIYLKGYEIAVKESQPMSIMTSYNLINGVPTADSYDLNTDIARGEWGFEGLIMTDWNGGSSSPDKSMHAGNDLIMPGGASRVTTIIKGACDYAPIFDEKGQIGLDTEMMMMFSYQVAAWRDFAVSSQGQDTVDAVLGDGYTASVDASGNILVNGENIYREYESNMWVGTGTYKTPVTTEVASVSADGKTITYKGDYADNNIISLGDVQRCAMNNLNIIMKSNDMARIYGTEALPYTEQFDNLVSWIQVDRSEVTVGDINASVVKGLKEMIAMIDGLDASEYTKESWAALETATEAAKAVVADENATQADYSEAMGNLVAAFGGLEYGVQKLHLSTAIEAAEAILQLSGDYESVDALEAAVEAGKAVLANGDATQEEVNAAANAILDQLFELAEVADVSSLRSLVNAAKNLFNGKYTSESLENLENAIAGAEAVLADPDREDGAISDAYASLVQAIMNLEMKGNKAALQSMLEKANEILEHADAYVSYTIAGLADAVADAQAVYDNDDAVQSEVNAAVEALTLKVAEARLLGDVDGDGTVTTGDSAKLLQANAEISSLSAEEEASADVNGDGTADTSDAVLILQYAAEKIAAF